MPEQITGQVVSIIDRVVTSQGHRIVVVENALGLFNLYADPKQFQVLRENFARNVALTHQHVYGSAIGKQDARATDTFAVIVGDISVPS